MILQVLRQIAALLALALFPAFISGAIQLEPRKAQVEEITPAEIVAGRAEIVWVDSRSAAEFAAGHAAHAILLTPEDWDRLVPPFLDAWHPSKVVVVYGERAASETVARRMRDDLQMKNVRVLKKGWERWKEK